MPNALDTLTESVADHQVDEFYAWNDFKNDFRALKVAGNELADSLDDLAADLSDGLDLFSSFDLIDEMADQVDLSKFELTFHDWQ